ncbi:MAG TPA: ABC transporter permease [Gaiellaceae bacterium]|nr:ABC transporter permease [Gaiellaceae bacterium]
MARYVLRRFLTSVVLLFVSSILIFLVMRVIPGDPTLTKLGGTIKDVDPKALAEIRHELGLDKSLPAQYLDWVGGILHGSFGHSYFSQFPVTTLIAQRIGATVELAVLAMLIGLLIAVPLATLSAIWRNRVFDGLLSGFAAVGMATPAFVTGIALIILFGLKLKWLPTQGYISFQHHPLDSIRSTLLPAITLGVSVAAPTLRILRASLVEIGSASFIRTAQGKGLLRHQVVVRHLLPNASIPALTTVGVIVGHLLGGAVVVEYVFARQGLGTLLVDSVFQRDYGVLQALVLLAAAAFIVTSLVVDILYGVIDPRLRVARTA